MEVLFSDSIIMARDIGGSSNHYFHTLPFNAVIQFCPRLELNVALHDLVRFSLAGDGASGFSSLYIAFSVTSP